MKLFIKSHKCDIMMYAHTFIYSMDQFCVLSCVSTFHDNYEYNLQHSKYCSRRGENFCMQSL